MNDSQKPRLSLAAGYHLRARPLCDGRIKMKDFELEAVPFENDGEGHDEFLSGIDACVHPTKLPTFNPAEALAYSCNYFFATTGKRLDRETFTELLHEFGFGRPTGIEDQSELSGVLARNKWQPQSPLGEGPFLQVTPVQMATAYAALFNGGALLKPNYDGVRKVRAQIHIDDKERSMLLDGMRGAVTFGTAEKANLDSLPVYIVGKTGTSTQLGGFRTQGWFVGVAFEPDAPPDPENAQLLVVIYLKNAHGSDAAKLARPIFEG